MTMSVQQQSDISELSENEQASDNNSVVTSLPTTKPTTKRSFDVAFLISPDDKIKQKRKINSSSTFNFHHENNEVVQQLVRQSSPEINKAYQKCPVKFGTFEETQSSISPSVSPARYVANSQSPLKQIFDDPRVVTSQNYTIERNTGPEQKSAFTKVKLDAGVVSPSHSISPELSYQNSLSPSPPILNAYVQKTFQNILPTAPSASNTIFKSTLSTYPHTFIENFPNNRENSPVFQPTKVSDQQILFKNQQNIDMFAPKLRHTVLNYRPEMNSYTTYPAAAAAAIGAFHQTAPDLVKFSHSTSPQDIIKLQTNPAAAILNSLLPPSLAALSLPAQNVCAKCNISFRMTSDLVYHMRSHHKNETASDSLKKRREDKLKCPVCSESFRERHHLTRHMTAHQDKEGDMEDTVVTQNTTSRKVRNVHNSNNSTNNYSNNNNNVYCK